MTEKKTIKEDNLATALCKAQSILTSVKKDKRNEFFKANYADLSAVFDAIREPFTSNGIAITQTIDVTNNGIQLLCTKLLHVSGEFIESKMILPIEQNPQKLGSLISYFRRYSLMAIAGLPASDDDGNAASGKSITMTTYISPDQVSELESIINGNIRVRKLLLDNCNGNLSSISADRFKGALKWVKEEVKKDKECS